MLMRDKDGKGGYGALAGRRVSYIPAAEIADDRKRNRRVVLRMQHTARAASRSTR